MAATALACGSSPEEGSESANAAATVGGRPCVGGTLSCTSPGCDPVTTCCYGGGQDMYASACGASLAKAGCRSVSNTTFAPFVQEDLYGHYWFEVFCPVSAAATAAVNGASCRAAGIHTSVRTQCTSNVTSPGRFEALYDPYCPSGCAIK